MVLGSYGVLQSKLKPKPAVKQMNNNHCRSKFLIANGCVSFAFLRATTKYITIGDAAFTILLIGYELPVGMGVVT